MELVPFFAFFIIFVEIVSWQHFVPLCKKSLAKRLYFEKMQLNYSNNKYRITFIFSNLIHD